MALRVEDIDVDRRVREKQPDKFRGGCILGRSGEVEDGPPEVVSRIDIDRRRGAQRAGARPGLASTGAEAAGVAVLTPAGVQQALEGLLVAKVEVGMESGHAVGECGEQRPGVLLTPLAVGLFVGRCARTGCATISLRLQRAETCRRSKNGKSRPKAGK